MLTFKNNIHNINEKRHNMKSEFKSNNLHLLEFSFIQNDFLIEI